MRSKFESRNTSFNGMERRMAQRRNTDDRRDNVRFDPSNQDRRNYRARRENDIDSWAMYGL